MQTFLPSKSFSQSAKMLDSRRLNKQVLEAFQILKILSGFAESNAWVNHPAVKMWKGSEFSLFSYAIAMLREAERRGIKVDKHRSNLNTLRALGVSSWGSELPQWYTSPELLKRVTTTHRANLFAKDQEFYGMFAGSAISPANRSCCDTCKYFWPTHVSERTLA